MSGGNKDLNSTLQSLRVLCDGVEYGFVSVDCSQDIDFRKLLGTFYEDGKLSIIATRMYLEELNIPCPVYFAQLSISVHTSLELVGLTAVLATKLAENGISANVVAAYYHDHVYVQYDRRDEAIQLLEGLAAA